ncbi:unnamed protein product [Lactuca saligna]|uniref:MYB transcription factor n=1 Tax=Lactuca saligna TaxID=75948 RepID=A0AA35YJ86_LACSI|nr:unnamed protein product [Lactuca saligna]
MRFEVNLSIISIGDCLGQIHKVEWLNWSIRPKIEIKEKGSGLRFLQFEKKKQPIEERDLMVFDREKKQGEDLWGFVGPKEKEEKKQEAAIDSWWVKNLLVLIGFMGAPKQKWTSEEEAALKAGVLKHGAGKWCTILKDPKFSSVLYLRSNVDIKDKWSNMSVMENGWGSKEKARLALKRVQHVPKDDNLLSLTTADPSDEDSGDVRPLQSSSGSPQVGASKRSMIRLDNLMMEAINNLKEHGGSNKTTIGTYIEFFPD